MRAFPPTRVGGFSKMHHFLRSFVMSFRTNHRQPLPQPRAEASARARVWSRNGGDLRGMQSQAAVETCASDPGGGVVI